jgi:hypothetical protein
MINRLIRVVEKLLLNENDVIFPLKRKLHLTEE